MSLFQNRPEDDTLRRLEEWVDGELPEETEEVHAFAGSSLSITEHLKNGIDRLDHAARSFLDQKAKTAGPVIYRVCAFVVCAVMIVVLLSVVNVLPPFGSPDNPGNNEVYEVYMGDTLYDTGALNAVGGLILNYRGYDTLNEAHVLFIAVCAVIILLRLDHKKGVVLDAQYEKDENDRQLEPHHDHILEKTAKILTPFVLLFSLTIMINGHLSPGGGFSGGAIASGGLILFLVTYGFAKSRRFFGEKVFNVVRTSALCIYTVIMTYFIYMGANQYENGIPLGTPGHILSAGISLPINIVVGLEVACTMYGLYALFRKGGLE